MCGPGERWALPALQHVLPLHTAHTFLAPLWLPTHPCSLIRLCDKSVSVRKKAVALLVALLHPSAGLAPAGAAALAVAALPVAAKLLGVKADSALHPGHEASKVGGGGTKEGKDRGRKGQGHVLCVL